MRRKYVLLMAGVVLTMASLTLHTLNTPWTGSGMTASFMEIR